jgi:hypothetical protein
VLTDADATHAFIASPIGMLLFGCAGNAVAQVELDLSAGRRDGSVGAAPKTVPMSRSGVEGFQL